MESIEFVTQYPNLINELRLITNPKWDSVLDEMESLDPHDLITPDSWFPNELMVRGYVYSLFLQKVRGVLGE
jgi:hypothetical protein